MDHFVYFCFGWHVTLDNLRILYAFNTHMLCNLVQTASSLFKISQSHSQRTTCHTYFAELLTQYFRYPNADTLTYWVGWQHTKLLNIRVILHHKFTSWSLANIN